MSKRIIAYKGFNMDLTCRDFQYEIGKEYNIDDEESISFCEKGFHACKKLRDVFSYYPFHISRFCKVELSGNIESSDSKFCASHIKILEEIDKNNIIDELINSGEIQYYIFSEGEEKVISNNYLGHIDSKDDWENVKDNCHIGSRMLILDNTYNVIWRCVHIGKNKGYYFISNSLGFYPIDKAGIEQRQSLYDTWLYENILSPLETDLKKIFKNDLLYITRKYKISIPSLEDIELIIKNGGVGGDLSTFTFFKIGIALNCLGIINDIPRDMWIQTKSVIPGSLFHINSWNTCTTNHYSLNSLGNICPLICLK